MSGTNLDTLLQHYTGKLPERYYHYILYIGTVDYGGNWDERGTVFPVLDLVTDDIQESDDWKKYFQDKKSHNEIPIYDTCITTTILEPYLL